MERSFDNLTAKQIGGCINSSNKQVKKLFDHLLKIEAAAEEETDSDGSDSTENAVYHQLHDKDEDYYSSGDSVGGIFALQTDNH